MTDQIVGGADAFIQRVFVQAGLVEERYGFVVRWRDGRRTDRRWSRTIRRRSFAARRRREGGQVRGVHLVDVAGERVQRVLVVNADEQLQLSLQVDLVRLRLAAGRWIVRRPPLAMTGG